MEETEEKKYAGYVGVDMGYVHAKPSHLALKEEVAAAMNWLSESELQEVLNYIDFMEYRESIKDMTTGDNEIIYPEQSE